jgi:hypothetical protein
MNDRERSYDSDDEQASEDFDAADFETEGTPPDSGEKASRSRPRAGARTTSKSTSRNRQHTGSKRSATGGGKRASQRTSHRPSR